MIRFPSPSLVISMVALVVALGDAGYSATGGAFILGQANGASTQTRLVTPLNGPAFRVDNSHTGVNASGLRIITNAARPPLVVNSGVKVANLNADKLDGIDATGFVQGSGVVIGKARALQAGDRINLGNVGGVDLDYICPTLLGPNDKGTFIFQNSTASILNVFLENHNFQIYHQIEPDKDLGLQPSPDSPMFSLQTQGELGIVSIQLATVIRHDRNDCHVQALFVWDRGTEAAGL